MSIPTVYFKSSDESEIYGVDFTSLLVSGETISSTTTTSTPSGVNIGIASETDGVVSFRVSGGVLGVTYQIIVQTTTSNNNVFEECVHITILGCGAMLEMVTILRVIIDDLSSPQTYSDSRLIQAICVAARYVQQDLQITTYTVSAVGGTISPEPDDVFKNMAALKAACFIDQSSLRSRAAAAGLRASLGPLQLDTSSSQGVQAFVELLKNGACSAYKELLEQYMFGNINIISAVLSPFTHNEFDPRGKRTGDDPFFH